MRVIDLNCPNCGANMKANAELKKAICNFCGHEILIDDERIDISISNGKQFGYEQEIGRQKARDERYKRYQKHLQFVKMKLALQYLIDMKSASLLSGASGFCLSFFLFFIALIIMSFQVVLAGLFAAAFSVCLYFTIITNKKIKKMERDLENNNLLDYIDQIKNVMDRDEIVEEAEEIARKDFGDI